MEILIVSWQLAETVQWGEVAPFFLWNSVQTFLDSSISTATHTVLVPLLTLGPNVQEKRVRKIDACAASDDVTQRIQLICEYNEASLRDLRDTEGQRRSPYNRRLHR